MKTITSRTFSNGFVSLLELEDGKRVETTSTCLPLSTELRDTKLSKDINIPDEEIENFNFWHEKWMIGISTQSGCPIRCKFCAVNKVTQEFGWRNLTDEEMIAQVQYAIDATYQKFHFHNANGAYLFRVLLTRMGEPSLNIKNVIKAIHRLKTFYPKLRVQVSTIGLKESIQLVEELMKLEDGFGKDWLELQFSVHSTDYKYRQWLQTTPVLTNEEINQLGKRYYDKFESRKWKVTLNFSLSKDTPFSAENLKKQFDSRVFFIKVSPINENCVSQENNLESLINYSNTL